MESSGEKPKTLVTKMMRSPITNTHTTKHKRRTHDELPTETQSAKRLQRTRHGTSRRKKKSTGRARLSPCWTETKQNRNRERATKLWGPNSLSLPPSHLLVLLSLVAAFPFPLSVASCWWYQRARRQHTHCPLSHVLYGHSGTLSRELSSSWPRRDENLADFFPSFHTVGWTTLCGAVHFLRTPVQSAARQKARLRPLTTKRETHEHTHTTATDKGGHFTFSLLFSKVGLRREIQLRRRE